MLRPPRARRRGSTSGRGEHVERGAKIAGLVEAERDDVAVALAAPREVEQDLREPRLVDRKRLAEHVAAVGGVPVPPGDRGRAAGSVGGGRDVPAAEGEAGGVPERDVLVGEALVLRALRAHGDGHVGKDAVGAAARLDPDRVAVAAGREVGLEGGRARIAQLVDRDDPVAASESRVRGALDGAGDGQGSLGGLPQAESDRGDVRVGDLGAGRGDHRLRGPEENPGEGGEHDREPADPPIQARDRHAGLPHGPSLSSIPSGT